MGFRVNMAGAHAFNSALAVSSRNVNSFAVTAVAAFHSIGVALASAMSVRAIAQAGDAMTTSLAKIEAAIGRSDTSAAQAQDIYEQLHQMGLRTGVGADESAASFARFNIAMEDIGRPASDTVTLLEGLHSSAIIAGTTTRELTQAMMQLGQALGSGKLQGDELRTMREAMPRFTRDIMREMGLTYAEFQEQATKGLLTPARLIPAMLRVSEGARAELANFPVTMARGFAILRASANRFLAELDKQLGLSRMLARAVMAISQVLERWRSGLGVVGRLVTQLGGLERILGVVAYAVGIATVAFVLLNRAMWVAIGRSLMLAAPWVAAGAVIVAFALMLQDFVMWLGGNDTGTLFGRWFGKFDDVIAPARDSINWFKQFFLDAWEAIKTIFFTTMTEIEAISTAFWPLLVQTVKTTIDEIRGIVGFLITLPDTLAAAWDTVVNYFTNLWNGIAAAFDAGVARIKPVVDWLRGAAGFLSGTGAGATSDPDNQRQRNHNFGSRSDASGYYGSPRRPGPVLPDLGPAPPVVAPIVPPDVTPRITGASNSSSTTVQHHTPIHINAPNSNPDSVAAAAQAGVNRADRNATGGTGGDLARGLTMGNPLVEQGAR